MNKKRVLIVVVFLTCLFAFFAMAFLAESKSLSGAQVASNLIKLIWNSLADMLGFFTSTMGIIILFVFGIAFAVSKQRCA